MNQQEIWAALVAGKTIVNPATGAKFKFEEGILHCCGMRYSGSFVEPFDYKIF